MTCDRGALPPMRYGKDNPLPRVHVVRVPALRDGDMPGLLPR